MLLTLDEAKARCPLLEETHLLYWTNSYNKIIEKGLSEALATTHANGNVEALKKLEYVSEARLLLTEIGKAISAANAKTIKDSILTMQSAIEKILPLVSEEVVSVDEAGKILAQQDSFDQLRYAVQNALRKRALSNAISTKVASGDMVDYDDYYEAYPYVRDMYEDYIVYSLSGNLYQCTYSVGSDKSITLGEDIPVQISYVPTTEAVKENNIDISNELVQLVEKAVKDDGTAKIKIISPGWGSSGYYSKEMLKRDGPKIFTKGTHMYMNHPTEDEDRNRPERDLKDLVGVIDSDVTWEEGVSGPGLYATAKVFSPFREFIDQAAPHIGVSIRAAGTAKEGQAEGRNGLIIDSLKEGYSVDYVTYPGRGGEILSLYESVRKFRETNVEVKETDVEITKEEFEALKQQAEKANLLESKLDTAIGTITALQEKVVVSDARVIASETLAGIEMPTAVRERVLAATLNAIPLTESRNLDKETLVKQVKEAADAEMKYIESITGAVTGGRVIGLSAPLTTELRAEEVDKQLDEAWKSFGFTDTELKIVNGGRI